MASYGPDETNAAPLACPNCKSAKLTLDSRATYRLVRYNGQLRWRLEHAWAQFDPDAWLQCSACGFEDALHDLDSKHEYEQPVDVVEPSDPQPLVEVLADLPDEVFEQRMDYLTS